MRKFVIGDAEQGQRFDKYVKRKLAAAPGSFIYKMIRKKNITLNGKKADEADIVKTGDEVAFFLSDETYDKFSGNSEQKTSDGIEQYVDAYKMIGRKYRTSPIIYEDKDILIAEKKPGVLSQKAAQDDISMNEWFIGYLLESGQLSASGMSEFTPSVCNRLDRNTGGILVFAKTLSGARFLSELLRSRKLGKFYRMVVLGEIKTPGNIKAYLVKDEKTNIVTVSETMPDESLKPQYIETAYRPVETGNGMTILECELITGKTHQLRAHLSHIGHPVAGDPKYGDDAWNDKLRQKFDIRYQMLYAVRIVFPEIQGDFDRLSGRIFELPMPTVYEKVLNRGL